ncbi:MAG: hypothetical protein OXT49_03490 [Gammaproteobacteria bacterium]|nr:hypothetical protein [Gammaproteobacteria bacterium]
MEPIEIAITVISLIAIIGPILTLYYTRHIAQVDKHKYQNWR